MSISYKLEKFEGPLDLLLHLIEKQKIDIYDIPISDIANQYLIYMENINKNNLDLCSEFLVMAATLLEIKAKLLLPKEIDEESEEALDPRQELTERLLEYKKFKELASELKKLEIKSEKYLYRAGNIPKEILKYKEPINIEALFKNIDLNLLNKIYIDLLKKEEERIDKQRANFKTIKREKISLEKKLNSILHYININKKFYFNNLLEERQSKPEIVVTFLAILELIKAGKIALKQEKTFSNIELEVLDGKCEDFDIKHLEDL